MPLLRLLPSAFVLALLGVLAFVDLLPGGFRLLPVVALLFAFPAASKWVLAGHRTDQAPADVRATRKVLVLVTLAMVPVTAVIVMVLSMALVPNALR